MERPPDGDRVDALVVGYYEGTRLLAAGKVRAGLTPGLRRELRTLTRAMRARMRTRDRLRGIVSLRSFGFAA